MVHPAVSQHFSTQMSTLLTLQYLILHQVFVNCRLCVPQQSRQSTASHYNTISYNHVSVAQARHASALLQHQCLRGHQVACGSPTVPRRGIRYELSHASAKRDLRRTKRVSLRSDSGLGLVLCPQLFAASRLRKMPPAVRRRTFQCADEPLLENHGASTTTAGGARSPARRDEEEAGSWSSSVSCLL